MDKKLEAEVCAWIDDDPDDETRAQLVAALATNNEEQLRSWFAGFLEFGTAGLRGPMGPGPSQMNRAVVGRTALGLASYMKARGLTSIAIGYDARHRSYRFALDTAELMAGAGIAAHVMPRTLPTPVLAYAVNHLKVDAGVMVTASHNPPEDNGYKVYLGGIVDGLEYRGSQIIAPADREIAGEIASITSLMSAPRSNSWQTIDESVIDAYRAATLRLGTSGEKSLRTVHTALHGVGTETFMKVVKAAGFSDTISVSEQAEPDPDFPTVAFPNPEEKGAIDLAIALAIREDADLVIANDPDADRCAAAFFDRQLGQWRMFKGDEVGAILGEMIARDGKSAPRFANSIVSSSLLAKIAEHHHIPFEETLTGFKWITKVAGLSYGYEEALGYCVDPATVNDKDGISAGLKMMEIAAELKSQGKTFNDLLDELTVRHGVYLTEQISIRVSDLSFISAKMKSLRAASPNEIGDEKVTSFEDLAMGTQLPPTDGLRFRTSLSRLIIRPSGTEPKLKCYLEVVVPVTTRGIDEARLIARKAMDALHASTATLLAD